MSTELLVRLYHCSRCGLDKPDECFNADTSRWSNRSSKCKDCTKAYNAEYRKKNRNKIKVLNRNYYLANSAAIKARSAQWRIDNYENYLSKVAEYLENHPEHNGNMRRARRARLAGVVRIPYSADQLAQRMSMWNGFCWICLERPFETVDHVKPLARGGPDILSNLRPACRHCNSSKRDTWPFKVVR